MLFASLVCLTSAFFLFLVQPMIGKYLLPIFGGGSSIWMVAMMCFQALLLLGYFYAYRLSQWPLKKQIFTHLLLLGTVWLGRWWLTKNWFSQIFPPSRLDSYLASFPEISVMLMIIIGVGGLFFLLSTTSSLVQSWQSRLVSKESPYPLYRFSNLGSFLALIAYPFLIEPNFKLMVTARWWFGGFGLFFLLMVVFGWWVSVNSQKRLKKLVKAGSLFTLKDKRVFWTWVGYSALAVICMMAFTNELTQGIAPAPFLWLLPLGIYLFSFILTFNERFHLSDRVWSVLFGLIFLFACFMNLGASTFFIGKVGVILYGLVLFLICLFLHQQLYQKKPESRYLTTFYLSIAIGGFLGGLLVGLIAPIVFLDYWEFNLAMIAVVWLIIKQVSRNPQSFWQRMYLNKSTLAPWMMTLIVAWGVGLVDQTGKTLYLNRSFYGTVRVAQSDQAVMLFNGHTLHGMQLKNQSESYVLKPGWYSYYHLDSGIGLVFQKLQSEKSALKVGIVGLGAGNLAAYCREADDFVFFEINPQVVTAAKKYFTNLEDCSKRAIIVGDGRQMLTNWVKEKNYPKFDLLVMDAFNDDSIPIHLLTLEAIQEYWEGLTSDGVLAIHISNRHLLLEVPMKQIAQAMGLEILVVENFNPSRPGSHPSIWVLLSRKRLTDEQLMGFNPKNANFKRSEEIADGDLWTDDFSNLVKILR